MLYGLEYLSKPVLIMHSAWILKRAGQKLLKAEGWERNREWWLIKIDSFPHLFVWLLPVPYPGIWHPRKNIVIPYAQGPCLENRSSIMKTLLMVATAGMGWASSGWADCMPVVVVGWDQVITPILRSLLDESRRDRFSDDIAADRRHHSATSSIRSSLSIIKARYIRVISLLHISDFNHLANSSSYTRFLTRIQASQEDQKSTPGWAGWRGSEVLPWMLCRHLSCPSPAAKDVVSPESDSEGLSHPCGPEGCHFVCSPVWQGVSQQLVRWHELTPTF